ncbi:Serine/threonine protein kinase [Phytophthora cinnamomi]|uniref:Serine/threonine protein kinase n=1 Tax=Phytophthora cinnamomi TaxID=4785 RepID=UPI0035597778|nr:Serine/threonine protein kinase [Phytophthora cinnamomi]
MRDAALEAGDGLDASVIAFCGRQVAQQLVDYEREPRLLVKLADTGRVVTVLLQASRTAAEVAPARDDDRDEEEGEDNDEDKDEEGREHVSKLTLWRRTLAEERVRRMEDIYEPLLSDDTRLMEEAGDEMQQQEILTLMKNDVEIYGAVLTEREIDVIVKLYSRIVRRSGVVVGTIPRWFATTTSLWPDVAKTVMTDTGEDFACQISIWRTLRHPNVLRLYADIYSFGMCMIEVLTGEYPWGAENDIAIKFQVKRGELPPRPAEMSDWEWELVKRMCRFDPNSRISIDAVVCYISGLNAETSS